MFPVHSGHAVSAIYILLPFIHGAGGLEWLEDILTETVILTIIYLTREPLVSVHLTAGKISVIRNSALLYQSRGAIFYVSKASQQE